MKTVIWVACVLAATAIVTLAKEKGMAVGGIPTALIYGGAILVSNVITKWYTQNHPDK